jgi:threonine/homoserine/homoserine lactone efflux protein
MPSTDHLVTFLIALFFLEISPGPDMMLILARGIGQGRKIAFMSVVGMIFVAGIVQVGLLVLGLASLLQAVPAAMTALRWIGGAYLIWLGIGMIRSSLGGKRPVTAAHRLSAWSAMREGATNSLTNPKSLLFMFAFLPQFVDPQAGPVWLQLLVLGALQKFAGILSLGSVALAAGTIGQWLLRWPWLLSWQRRFTGIVMIGLGIRLLFGTASALRPVPAPAGD